MPLPLYSEKKEFMLYHLDDHANLIRVEIQVTHLRSGYVGKAVDGGGLKKLFQHLHRPLQRNLD